MDENKVKSINFIINDLQDSITEIWEELLDDEKKEAIKKIDETIDKLKSLKNNLIKKES